MIYEHGVCECGFHESLTTDRSNHFTFDVRECPVCKGAAKFARIQQHADEQADKRLGDDPPPTAARAGDGRRTYLRQMSPLEVAALVAQKSPGK